MQYHFHFRFIFVVWTVCVCAWNYLYFILYIFVIKVLKLYWNWTFSNCWHGMHRVVCTDTINTTNRNWYFVEFNDMVLKLHARMLYIFVSEYKIIKWALVLVCVCFGRVATKINKQILWSTAKVIAFKIKTGRHIVYLYQIIESNVCLYVRTYGGMWWLCKFHSKFINNEYLKYLVKRFIGNVDSNI